MSEQSTTESGRGREGRGRGRGNRKRFHMRSKKDKSFKGNTPEMNGHVFEGYGESVEKQQYTKTVNALAELISKTMDYPKDVVSICKIFELNDVRSQRTLHQKKRRVIQKSSSGRQTYRRT